MIGNSPASMQTWVDKADRLRVDLPDEVRTALDRHDAAGTIEDPEYLAATEAFYDRHVCRVHPLTEEVQRSFDAMGEDSTVYGLMNGPNEFLCIGSLRSWSIVERAHQIAVPTQLVSGEFDEATPATVQPLFDAIPDVRWERIDGASHMPLVERPEAYDAVVTEFLAAHDPS